VHDLTKPLPFSENSFSVIYGSHVLEHLYLTDARRLLSECERILKPGGVIRLVVPDLYHMVDTYLKNKMGQIFPVNGTATPADYLNERLGFRLPNPTEGNILRKVYTSWKDFHSHKWMYDSESLINYLRLAGFEHVSHKQFLESDVEGIADVEEAERVLNGAGICVEGTKTKLLLTR
jgi:ubiquinone/menaquinone biosynthesis C-methylase UbiE